MPANIATAASVESIRRNKEGNAYTLHMGVDDGPPTAVTCSGDRMILGWTGHEAGWGISDLPHESRLEPSEWGSARVE